MKRFIVLFFVLTTGFYNWAGEVVLPLANFNKVEVIGNYSITFIKADRNELVIDNQDAKVEDNAILAKVFDGALTIQIQMDTYVKRNIEMTLYYQAVDHIIAKRGAEIEAGKLSPKQLTLFVNSGGKIKLSANVETIDIAIKSGGSVKITGQANEANFNVQMGGIIAASFFNVNFAKAVVQMGGEMIINVTEELTASIKAGGEISYKGSPKKVNESIKLGGSIDKIEN